MMSIATPEIQEPAVRVQRLRHVGLIVPDPVESASFYEEIWGLRHVDDKNGVVFLRALGTEHHVLELHPGPRKGIHHVSFALDSFHDVDAAAPRLRDRGLHLIDGPRHLEESGGGYGLRFVDPEGRRIELTAEVELVHTGDWQAPVLPRKISHTVLNTTNIDAATSFFRDVLGFRISDWSEHQMVFLRCNTDHHSIAFNQAPHASLNHIAYELPSMEDVMRGIGHFRKFGRSQMWGPGRHGPGNNVFCYFQDPAGLVCEYTSDVLQIVDESKWEPHVWQRTPEQMDRWGTAGAPSAEARLAMAGEPDPGVLVDSHQGLT